MKKIFPFLNYLLSFFVAINLKIDNRKIDLFIDYFENMRCPHFIINHFFFQLFSSGSKSKKKSRKLDWINYFLEYFKINLKITRSSSRSIFRFQKVVSKPYKVWSFEMTFIRDIKFIFQKNQWQKNSGWHLYTKNIKSFLKSHREISVIFFN